MNFTKHLTTCSDCVYALPLKNSTPFRKPTYLSINFLLLSLATPLFPNSFKSDNIFTSQNIWFWFYFIFGL